MLKKQLRASLVQYNCPLDKSMALTQIYDLVKEAGPKSDLILLGEIPYTPYTTVKNFSGVAENIPGNFSDELCSLAKEYGSYICSGVVERDRDNIYNTALLISPDGKIIHKHRKVSLASSDIDGGFCAGEEIAIVETEFGKIGILICLDSSDKNNIHAMSALNPDLILVPAYGLAKTDYSKELSIDCMIDECIDEWRARMKMLAKYCKSYVLRSDHCGMEEFQVRVGHSLGVTPGGYVISEATMKPSILNITLDPSSVSQKSW